MLTKKMLEQMPPHTIFATGITTDNAAGCNMSGTGLPLGWLAVRGEIHDWAIYVGMQDQDIWFIKNYGNKVTMATNIRNLVECDDEALALYRR